MRFAPVFLAALLLVGCGSSDSSTATKTDTPPADAPKADAPKADSPKSDAPKADAPKTDGKGSATLEAPKFDLKADPNAKVDSLVNPDGKIDAGLSKTAAPGAKTPKAGDDIAILNTDQGRIVVRFFPQVAPNHVKNFLYLAGKGFYDGTKFHRVIPKFMIQGGDPLTKGPDSTSYGQGGPGWNVPHEFNDVPHTPGILSMARTQDPDGAGSQFFIIHGTSSFLDHQYSVFGQVIEGLDVVDKIVHVPTHQGGDGAPSAPDKPPVITKVEVTKWPVKLK